MADSYVDYMRNRRAMANEHKDSAHVALVGIRYFKFGEDTHGTIGVKLHSSSTNSVQVCEYTKVALDREEDDQVFFQIMDGPYGGRRGSIKSSARDVLQKTPPTISNETVRVKYGSMGDEVSDFKGRLRQQWATLTIGGQDITVTLNSVWDKNFTPIAPGRHRIMVPGRSHGNVSTEGYRNAYPGRIKANDAWFPIELQNTTGNSSRFVHIGHLSEGCVTVHDLARWNSVYDFLISHRLPNTEGKYVAMLEVTK